jgi:hypothetical protein
MRGPRHQGLLPDHVVRAPAAALSPRDMRVVEAAVLATWLGRYTSPDVNG